MLNCFELCDGDGNGGAGGAVFSLFQKQNFINKCS